LYRISVGAWEFGGRERQEFCVFGDCDGVFRREVSDAKWLMEQDIGGKAKKGRKSKKGVSRGLWLGSGVGNKGVE